MKKICIVLSNDYLSVPNGGHARTAAMVNGLQKNGFDISIVSPVLTSKMLNDINNVDIYTVPVISKKSIINQIYRTFLIVREARKIAKYTGATIQFEHSLLGGFAAIMGYSNFVLHMHDIAFDSKEFEDNSRVLKKIIYYIEKIAVRRALKIIVVSTYMKKIVMDEWNISEEKISVIPNGYFESRLIEFQNIEEEKNLVLFMGTLNKKLDINKFIGVATLLKSRGGTLYIIGNGIIKNLLEEEVKKNNFENVIITGYLPDKDAYTLLAKSQVTIFPLKRQRSMNIESMCAVKVFDYAALGKAMVLNDVSPMTRIFKINGAALVSDPDNQKEFVENVKILLDDESLRKKISSSAKNLVKNYTWEKQAEKLVKMYNELM